MFPDNSVHVDEFVKPGYHLVTPARCTGSRAAPTPRLPHRQAADNPNARTAGALPRSTASASKHSMQHWYVRMEVNAERHRFARDVGRGVIISVLGSTGSPARKIARQLIEDGHGADLVEGTVQ